MKTLNLKTELKKLGTRKLCDLVGSDRLEVINNISNSSITETNIVKILFTRYGTQILSNKQLRTELLSSLPTNLQYYLLTGKEENVQLSEIQLERLLNSSWGRTYKITQRIIKLFGLSEEYLPPENIEVPDFEKINPEVKLYPYQQRVKDKFIRTLLNKENRLLIHMPTGSGKTRTTIEGLIDYWRAIANRSGYIVWLAHSEELCEQAVETFSKLWRVRGDSEMKIFRLWGSHNAPDFNEESGIVVASLQKVHSMRVSNTNETFISISNLKNNCQFIVIDEAHKAIAPTYKSSIEYLSSNETKVIGLTATPGRSDDFSENEELASFFHNNKISISDSINKEVEDPILYLQNREFLSEITREEISTNINLDLTDYEKDFVSTFLEVPKSVLQKLADEDERNVLIIGKLAELYNQKKQIIVFALTVEHSHLLAELLQLRGINARSIDGKTPEFERKKIIRDYKNNEINIIINYGVLTTGFDAPNTNVIMITRPTGSLVLYSQMLGRGIRGKKMGGNKECLLVDLKDNLIGFPDERLAFSYYNNSWNKK